MPNETSTSKREGQEKSPDQSGESSQKWEGSEEEGSKRRVETPMSDEERQEGWIAATKEKSAGQEPSVGANSNTKTETDPVVKSEAKQVDQSRAEVPESEKTREPAEKEIRELGPLEGKPKAEIEPMLKERGYTDVPANSGGTVWTKDCPGGCTAAVRIDPAVVRDPPQNKFDEKPHVHKEIVPTNKVSDGNYHPRSAETYDDNGKPTSTNDHEANHIPGGH
jgi:hypothetical protein